MCLSRCSFVFEFMAVVIVVPGTQWGLCIMWNGRIYTHVWDGYDLILLSVWPIYVTSVPKGLSKSRRLDLQLVTQLRGDWIFRGFTHWWVCRGLGAGDQLRELEHRGGGHACEGCPSSLIPRLFLDPAQWGFSPLLFLHNVLVLSQAQSNSQLSLAEISET